MSGVGTQKEKEKKLNFDVRNIFGVTYLASLDMLFKILLILPFSVTNSHVKWAIHPSIHLGADSANQINKPCPFSFEKNERKQRTVGRVWPILAL